MASVDEFTKADADAIVQIAQEAPIPGGARQAAARSDLYQRFVKFYERATKPAPPARQPRKSRSVEPTVEELTK